MDQPLKHQQDVFVRLGRRHLVETAVLGQSEQPSLLAGDAAMTMKVQFVPNDNDGDGRRLPAAPDELQLLADHVEAAAVADTVDEDEAVGPLQLFVRERQTLPIILMTKHNHRFTLRVDPVRRHTKQSDVIESATN